MAADIKFNKKVKIRKKTGKHSKKKGPKETPQSEYRGQGKNN